MKRKLFYMIICTALLVGCGVSKEEPGPAADTLDIVDSPNTVDPAVTLDSVDTDTSYGVFIGAGPEDIQRMMDYDIVVIDAQYFDVGQIKELQSDGHKVYSYINVGSVEDFRPYYQDYQQYTLDVYEHWEDERWVDVSAAEWQDFILEELAPDILGKGVDGLFVDNVDVYYVYPDREIFDGTEKILKGLKSLDTYVLINGGDNFVTKYIDEHGSFRDIADGVNQESVFSRIEWDNDTFSENDPKEQEYFREYVEKVSDNGGDVYLLEYTTDSGLASKIREYCSQHGFKYYISTTLELL